MAVHSGHPKFPVAVCRAAWDLYRNGTQKFWEGTERSEAEKDWRIVVKCSEWTMPVLWEKSELLARHENLTIRAYSQCQLGQSAAAAESCRQIIAYWPNHPDTHKVKLALAEALEKLTSDNTLPAAETHQEIEAVLKAILAENRGWVSSSRAAVALGDLYFQTGNWLESARYYERFLTEAKDKNSKPRIAQKLATVYSNLNRSDLAADVLSEYILNETGAAILGSVGRLQALQTTLP